MAAIAIEQQYTLYIALFAKHRHYIQICRERLRIFIVYCLKRGHSFPPGDSLEKTEYSFLKYAELFEANPRTQKNIAADHISRLTGAFPSAFPKFPPVTVSDGSSRSLLRVSMGFTPLSVEIYNHKLHPVQSFVKQLLAI
jgi:hypothetical protein